MSTRRMKKVKITKEGKINIIYEKQMKSTWDEYSFICSEHAKPSFYESFTKMIPYVIELCELPDEYKQRITVKSISFSYGGDDEVMGATMSAAMELQHSNCPLNLNTPHKPSEPYNAMQEEPIPDQCLTEECVAALDNICAEAVAYIDGEREQTSLFQEKTIRETENHEENIHYQQ